MTTHTLPTAPAYRDRKRYAWLLSVLVPLTLGAGPLAIEQGMDPLWVWLPSLFIFNVIPVVDWLMGEDQSNPPESAVPALEADRYYRYVTYAVVPILWLVFGGTVAYLCITDLPWYIQLALGLNAAVCGGFGINLGHELGHKNPPMERWLAKIALAPTGYGHFFVEHNRGHHRDVATPGDPASSRMGENIYAFCWREMPGGLRRAWQLEKERLGRKRQAVWSRHNEVLQPALMTLVLWGALVICLGWIALFYCVLISFWANFQLTGANYIEHYGLLRRVGPDGQLERCQPHHSWNSNHVFSNWVLFHLQRHSDHHAHPSRRYQSLRHFEGLPELPSGYPGVILVSYFPPLWYAMMDHRLVRAVNGDASRINFQPGKQEQLTRRFQLKPLQQDAV